jgi:hypothetical protein
MVGSELSILPERPNPPFSQKRLLRLLAGLNAKASVPLPRVSGSILLVRSFNREDQKPAGLDLFLEVEVAQALAC